MEIAELFVITIFFGFMLYLIHWNYGRRLELRDVWIYLFLGFIITLIFNSINKIPSEIFQIFLNYIKNISIPTAVSIAISMIIAISGIYLARISLINSELSRILEVEKKIYPKIRIPFLGRIYNGEILFDIYYYEEILNFKITPHKWSGIMIDSTEEIEYYYILNEASKYKLNSNNKTIKRLYLPMNNSPGIIRFPQYPGYSDKLHFIKIEYMSIYHNKYVHIFEVKTKELDLIYNLIPWNNKAWISPDYSSIKIVDNRIYINSTNPERLPDFINRLKESTIDTIKIILNKKRDN